MRQRVMIAMALACHPAVLLADEPTTALDVTVQAQILLLTLDLRREFGTAIVLITHDLGVIAETADRAVVMYAGRKVEEAPVARLFVQPRHPYTAGLLRAVPRVDRAGTPARKPLAQIAGMVPPLDKARLLVAALRRAARIATDLCRREEPPLEMSAPGHFAACWHSARATEATVVSTRPASDRPAPLLEVDNLVKRFPVSGGLLRPATAFVHAVDGVSFTLHAGETLGIVGESGCGKSTLARMIVRLIDPTGGAVRLRGVDISRLRPGAMRRHRRDIQFVFQDPYASLNPRLRAGSIVGEAIENFGEASRRAVAEQVAVLFQRVGLRPAQMHNYPHEFSGGQRQRLGIARALALKPGVIVADEPVSALDVSVQAQVINLMVGLQQEFGIAYLFIAHDLAVVQHISHRVAVMYLGRIVEIAPRDALFGAPLHPYTEALLDSVPIPDPALRRDKDVLAGEVPSPINPPPGCHFHTRCPLVQARCRTEAPAMVEARPDHFVACHVRAPAVAEHDARMSGAAVVGKLTQLELQLRKPRIEAARGGKLRMRALLDDVALVEHQDAGRIDCTVASRCAITKVVRPCINRSSATCTSRSPRHRATRSPSSSSSSGASRRIARDREALTLAAGERSRRARRSAFRSAAAGG